MASSSAIRIKSSIAARLIRKVFLIYVVIALVITVLHLFLEYKRVKNDVIHEMDRSVETIDTPLSISLWDADIEQLTSLEEGLLANRMIIGLCVIEAERECTNPMGSVLEIDQMQDGVSDQKVELRGSGSNRGVFGAAYPIWHQDSRSPHPLGTLVLFSSEYLILNMMKNQVLYIIISAAVKAVVLWIGFLWFSWRLLTKPLFHLATKATEVTTENLHPFERTEDYNHQDELTALHDAFNTMITNLDEGVQKQQDLYQKLEQYKSNLEVLVDERTLELQEMNEQLQEEMRERKEIEEQLLQSQKMKAIGTLAGGIAHDFNNLLLGVQGRASVILSRLERTDPFYCELQEIEEYVGKAKNLTQQLLGVARGGRYNPKPANLSGLVEKSSEMFGRTRKDIEIEVVLQDKEVVVEVDSLQLEQVMLNLFLNASQAMDGGGRISVVVTSEVLNHDVIAGYDREPGDYGVIKVTDTGSGMDEHTLSQVFNPFFTTREMDRGTGLGLASAYGIIKRHGGFITAESEVGLGSTFTIFLPCSEQRIAVGMDMPEELVTAEMKSGDGRILLIDDEELVRDVGGAMISELGYDVVIAGGGVEGVQLFEDDTDGFELVILDLIMPGQDGVTTFDLIRKCKPEQQILIASGYAMDRKIEALLKKGAAGFIQKPFGLTALSQQLEKSVHG